MTENTANTAQNPIDATTAGAGATAAGAGATATSTPVPTQAASTGNATAPSSTGETLIPGELVREVTEENFEAIMELSMQVPVVLDMWAPWCGPCRQLGPILEEAVAEAGGRIVLGKVNVDDSPAIGQAFRVQGIPAVFLLLGGRPAPLFTGAVPATAVKQAFDVVLAEAQKQGITGRVSGQEADSAARTAQTAGAVGVGAAAGAAGAAGAEAKPTELQQAQAKAAAGDFDAALADLEHYLKANPTEAPQVEPLISQVRLQARSAQQGAESVAGVEHGNAAALTDVPAQLAAADAQMNASDAAGALSRLLAVVSQTAGEDREAARERLVEYFQILGDDPIVAPMRQKLMTLLY